MSVYLTFNYLWGVIYSMGQVRFNTFLQINVLF